jgi:nucleotide-binding universal stress UspA family protein
MRNILIATDGSEGANRAVKAGAALARELGAALTLVTIGPRLPSEEQGQFARVEGDAADAAETFARTILNDAEEIVRQAGGDEPKVSLAFGEPTEEIIALARQASADAIVVGRRGRGQLSGLLLGSVSQKLASLAPCAVIIMP